MPSPHAAPVRVDLPVPVALLGFGVLAATVDAALTWFAIQVSHAHGALSFVELNPAMRGLMDEVGPAPAMGLRVLAGAVLFGFLAWAARRSRWTWRPLAIATFLTWLVVTWNVTGLFLAVL